jgi:glycosyltransferase involved in cell wall biosynthesis
MEKPLIALLGRKETPTDGVEDYCSYLGRALEKRGVRIDPVRVDWHERGWLRALRDLRRASGEWRHSWVIVQYTALAWSRRGFPFGVLAVVASLRRRGARCAVLFHESSRQSGGTRLRDMFRGACQDWVIRWLYRVAEKAVFTIPVANVDWLPPNNSKATFIPIGANIPERPSAEPPGGRRGNGGRAVAVFCLSRGANLQLEIADLAHAARRVHDSLGAVRIVVLGKGSAEARPEIEKALDTCGAEVSVLGRLPADQVADILSGADALLYLYGHVAQTRGSALAGIACGLPIIGYSVGACGTPIEEAGVELVPYRDRQALAAALVHVLSDDEHRAELRQRSQAAQRRHFSWESIAEKYIETFDLECAPMKPTRDARSRADQVLRPTE